MPDDYVLGIDMGTSGAKVGLVSRQGALLRLASEPYPLSSPAPGWAEQDAADWWRALQRGVRQVMAGLDPASVAAIGLSNAGGSFVAVDESGEPVRPAIVWMDRRSGLRFRSIVQEQGPQFWMERTGRSRVSSNVVGKLCWLGENEPQAYARIHCVLQGADYAVYRLTGCQVTDHSNACATGLYNLQGRKWDPDILAITGISRSVLPDLADPGAVAGGLLGGVASELGLQAGTPVVLGAWDQACVVVGAGAISGQDALLSTGTAWVLSHAMQQLPVDPAGCGIPCWHARQGEYLFMLAMSNGGSVVEWYRHTLAAAESEGGQAAPTPSGQLTGIPAGVEEVPPGSEGTLFLPHLVGAAAPHCDSDYSGCILGLRHGTTKAQIFRSILEAVAYETRWGLEFLAGMGRVAPRVRMIGGATRSPIWPQIVADVTGLEVLIPEQVECALLGAARLAQRAVGLQTEEEKVDRLARRTVPDAESARAYQELYQIYQEAYWALKAPLGRLKALHKDLGGV